MEIRNPRLIPVFRVLDKLADLGDLRPNIKHAVAVNHMRLLPEVQKFEELRKDEIRAHAIVEEDGSFAMDETGNPQFETLEARQATEEGIEGLLDSSIHIQLEQMDLSDLLQHEKVTSRDVMTLQGSPDDASLVKDNSREEDEAQ